MTAPVLAQGVGDSGISVGAGRLRWLVVCGGCAAAVVTFALASANDDMGQAGLQAALLNWITLPYILAGTVAWARRPDSRFGPLMVAAGFAMFLSSLQWSSASFPYTIGLAFDLLPAAVLLHLFLAFPSGRLEHAAERGLVGAAYFAAVGLQLTKMLLGGEESKNALAAVTESGAANTVEDIQLFALSGLSLAGIGVLVARRRSSPWRMRRRIALLVDTFALGLVAIAVLMLAGAFDWPSFGTIRRVAFALIGAAPVAFLIGLLNSQLSRRPLADLLGQLRTDPAPADLRHALADALRDPSLTLAYWLPEFGSWVDLRGWPVQLPQDDSERAATLIDRDGEPVAALIHDPSLADEPQLLESVSAAAAIALDNGRL
ncbi:MAG TPA: hypothetical protein VGI67_18295, partial [Thermoleophilaceae bacterium]